MGLQASSPTARHKVSESGDGEGPFQPVCDGILFPRVTRCTAPKAEGVTLKARRLHKSTAQQILRKRLYMGEFDWDGGTYQGTHEPLVTRHCWERVQGLLDVRAESKTRKVKT